MAKKAEALSLREAVKAAGGLITNEEVRRILEPLVHNAKKVLKYRDDQLEKAAKKRTAEGNSRKKAKRQKKEKKAAPASESHEHAAAAGK